MALYDHIQELRAELSACISRREMRQIERELKAAIAEQARLAQQFSSEVAGELQMT